MRWLVVCSLLFIFLQMLGGVSNAADHALVLRAMSAVPSSGSEWIALENVSSASTSAQVWSIRDVQGSVKTWSIPALPPYAVVTFLGTETKISLNNTGDQVELLQGSGVVQTSTPYEELASGEIWALLSNGWQAISQEDWDKRWVVRDWVVVASSPPVLSSPAASPRSSPSVAVLSSPIPTPSIPVLQPTPSPLELFTPEIYWWERVVLPHMNLLAEVSSAKQGTLPVWERPVGDFSQEEDSFTSWKLKLYRWLFLTFAGSSFLVFLSAPRLLRCYNDVCLLDDG